jgi:hypothetical protein
VSRPRAFVINLLVGAGAVVTLALALEAGLAVARINSRSGIVLDPEKGIGFAPHAAYVQRKEGFSEGVFNSHGFRDYERTWEKPPGTYRILVLGDSYVEAFQVPLERAFPALLEAKLNAASGTKRFEVLALGQSGFGTADAYMRYLHDGVRYSPDLVILAFLTGNDVRDNSQVLNLGRVGFYFRADGDGDLVLDRSTLDAYYQEQMTPLRRLVRAIKRRSYLASLVSERVFLLREEIRQGRFKEAHASPNGRSRGLEEFSDLNVYLPEPTPRWTAAWEITERVLLKFAGDVERRGTSFLLVTLSNAEQVHPELQQELAGQYGLPFDFDLPDRRLRAFAAKHGIPCLPLAPAFRAFHQRTGTYLHGFGSTITGHWNEAGHLRAAEEIFSFIRERRLVPLDAA